MWFLKLSPWQDTESRHLQLKFVLWCCATGMYVCTSVSTLFHTVTAIVTLPYSSHTCSLNLPFWLSKQPQPLPPSHPPLFTSDECHWWRAGGLGGVLLLHVDTVPGEGQPEAEDAALPGPPQSQEHVLQGQPSTLIAVTSMYNQAVC